jgi:hypothetical protein
MNRWSKNAVLDRVFEELQHAQIVRVKIEAVGLDSTIICASTATQGMAQSNGAVVGPAGTESLRDISSSFNWSHDQADLLRRAARCAPIWGASGKTAFYERGCLLTTDQSSTACAGGQLQTAGLIHYNRGKITVVDRAGLEEAGLRVLWYGEKPVRSPAARSTGS